MRGSFPKSEIAVGSEDGYRAVPSPKTSHAYHTPTIHMCSCIERYDMHIRRYRP